MLKYVKYCLKTKNCCLKTQIKHSEWNTANENKSQMKKTSGVGGSSIMRYNKMKVYKGAMNYIITRIKHRHCISKAFLFFYKY